MRQAPVEWNDHIRQFIKIKLEKPQVLRELVKRERDFAQRLENQHKIQSLRAQYEARAKAFRAQQAQHEQRLSLKQHLQHEVSQLNGHIIRMEVEIDRLTHEPPLLTYKQEKEERTRQSINSDTFPNKKQEELSAILVEHASTRDAITSQVTCLIAKRVQLTEQFEKAAEILQQQINRKQVYEHLKQAQQSLRDLQNKLEKQQDRKYKLSNRIAKAEKKAYEIRKSRDCFEQGLQQSSKRLEHFAKECKKILMGEEDRSSKKYQQFVDKYRAYSREEEERLKQQFHSSLGRFNGGPLRHSLSPVPVEAKTEKYEDLVVQLMKKFGKKSFTAKQFSDLQNRVKEIATYYAQLLETDSQLDPEIDSLREHLKRKIKQVEAVKSNPAFNRKSH